MTAGSGIQLSAGMSRTKRTHRNGRDGKEPSYGLDIRSTQRTLVTVPRRRQDAETVRKIVMEAADPDDEVLGTGTRKPNPLHDLV